MCGHDPNCCGLNAGECFCDHLDSKGVPDCESCPNSNARKCKFCGKKTLDKLLGTKEEKNGFWIEKCYMCGEINQWKKDK